MGNVNEKFDYIGGTKNEIKTAIINKGVSIPLETTFREYASKINEIIQNPDVSMEIRTLNGDDTFQSPEMEINRALQSKQDIYSSIQSKGIWMDGTEPFNTYATKIANIIQPPDLSIQIQTLNGDNTFQSPDIELQRALQSKSNIFNSLQAKGIWMDGSELFETYSIKIDGLVLDQFPDLSMQIQALNGDSTFQSSDIELQRAITTKGNIKISLQNKGVWFDGNEMFDDFPTKIDSIYIFPDLTMQINSLNIDNQGGTPEEELQRAITTRQSIKISLQNKGVWFDGNENFNDYVGKIDGIMLYPDLTIYINDLNGDSSGQSPDMELGRAINSKIDIRNSIISKGVNVDGLELFENYASKISEIIQNPDLTIFIDDLNGYSTGQSPDIELNRIMNTKIDIRNSIIGKGVDVDGLEAFENYASKIEEIVQNPDLSLQIDDLNGDSSGQSPDMELDRAIYSKYEIYQRIIGKGVNMTGMETFAEYANKIEDIVQEPDLTERILNLNGDTTGQSSEIEFDRIEYAKYDIYQSIIGKGVNMTGTEMFAEYASKIDEIVQEPDLSNLITTINGNDTEQGSMFELIRVVDSKSSIWNSIGAKGVIIDGSELFENYASKIDEIIQNPDLTVFVDELNGNNSGQATDVEINRAINSKNDIATSIINKGVIVQQSEPLENYASFIDQIQASQEAINIIDQINGDSLGLTPIEDLNRTLASKQAIYDVMVSKGIVFSGSETFDQYASMIDQFLTGIV